MTPLFLPSLTCGPAGPRRVRRLPVERARPGGTGRAWKTHVSRILMNQAVSGMTGVLAGSRGLQTRSRFRVMIVAARACGLGTFSGV